jgi:hypothetical protein
MITFPVRYHVSRFLPANVRIMALCALGVVGVSLGTTFLFAAFVIFACVTLPMLTASQLRWSTQLLAYQASLVDGHPPSSSAKTPPLGVADGTCQDAVISRAREARPPLIRP